MILYCTLAAQVNRKIESDIEFRDRRDQVILLVGKIPDDRGFHRFPTVPDSPDSDFGGKWKVRQKLNLVTS